MTTDNTTFDKSCSEYHDTTTIELLKDGKYICRLEFNAIQANKDGLHTFEAIDLAQSMYCVARAILDGYIKIEGIPEYNNNDNTNQTEKIKQLEELITEYKILTKQILDKVDNKLESMGAKP